MVLAVFVSAAVCQYQDEEGYSRDEIQGKVLKFKSMRTTGFVLGGIGAVALATGIILASNAQWESQSSSTGTEITTQDANGGAGLICIVIGAPMTIAGLVVGLIGNGKYKEYKYRLDILGGYNPYKKIYSTRLVANF
jgi:hypothetical protein